MFVGSVGVRGAEDCVALFVVGYCDVLVSAAGSDGKSASVVGVEYGEWHFGYEELVVEGQVVGRCGCCGLFFVWFGEYCEAIC